MTNGDDSAYPVLSHSHQGVDDYGDKCFHHCSSEGLTKREKIAAQLYAAMVSNPKLVGLLGDLNTTTVYAAELRIQAIAEADLLIEALNRTPETDGRAPAAIRHGVNCEKVVHDPNRYGYLHSAYYDGPYYVDGCKYCGRCHTSIYEATP